MDAIFTFRNHYPWTPTNYMNYNSHCTYPLRPHDPGRPRDVYSPYEPVLLACRRGNGRRQQAVYNFYGCPANARARRNYERLENLESSITCPSTDNRPPSGSKRMRRERHVLRLLRPTMPLRPSRTTIPPRSSRILPPRFWQPSGPGGRRILPP